MKGSLKIDFNFDTNCPVIKIRVPSDTSDLRDKHLAVFFERLGYDSAWLHVSPMNVSPESGVVETEYHITPIESTPEQLRENAKVMNTWADRISSRMETANVKGTNTASSGSIDMLLRFEPKDRSLINLALEQISTAQRLLEEKRIELMKQSFLLSDDKQQYIEDEEEVIVSKKPKKTKLVKRGIIKWVEQFKDADTGKVFPVQRHMIVKQDGEWLPHLFS